MEPLFRLTLIRPAVNQDESNPSIDLAQDTPLQKALEDAAKADKPREALREPAGQGRAVDRCSPLGHAQGVVDLPINSHASFPDGPKGRARNP